MAGHVFPMKKSNVSYSNFKTCKALSVPFLDVKYRFGTKLYDPVWKKAVTAEDFVPYRKDKLDGKSEMSLFRTAKHLVVGFFFHEPPENFVKPEDAGSSVWSGDMAEIHIGGMEPDPWLFQTGIGITGIRFDSTGNYDMWQAKVFETENGWGAEVRFDLSLLRLTEGGFRFNLCRQSLKRKEFSSWSPLLLRFHEVENFGELLFTDYKTALEMKSGKAVPGKVSRADYELACGRGMLRAQQVTHGPYLSAPDADSVQICWETAGRVPGFAEYREKGSKKKIRAFSGRANGILAHETTHSVHLTGLTPGKEYEYEIFTLTPVLLEPESTGIKRSFRIPEKDRKNFSFFCITDIHSDVGYIRRALSLPEAEGADFTILLGDNLSHAAGREALYTGVVDPVEKLISRGGQDKPIVFVRGNHEQIGVYANEYFKVMGHPSGKTYYSFTWGSAFFIVLDSQNDHLDEGLMYSNTEERLLQKEYLAEIVKSEAYRKADFRVVLVHIPPVEIPEDPSMENFVYGMTEPLRTAAVKPDVMLCGHLHEYERVNANEDRYDPASNSIHSRKKRKTLLNPFPVIVHTNTAGLCGKFSSGTLEISVIETPDGKPAELIDRIKIKRRK